MGRLADDDPMNTVGLSTWIHSHLTKPTKGMLGQAGDGISASSPGPAMSRVAISIACMPPMVTKKFSGEKAPPPGASP